MSLIGWARGRLPRVLRWDTAVASAVAAAVVVSGLFVLDAGESSTPVRVLRWALTLVAVGALYVRGRRPVAAAVLTLAACALYYPLGEPDGPLLLTFALALYTAASAGHVRSAAVLGVTTIVAMGLGEAISSVRHVDNLSLLLSSGWLIAAIAGGAVVRSHRAYRHEVEQRALDAERGRAEEARRHATEERLRIARELHDVLGHSISLINVQAAAALHRIERDPAQAETALAAIKQTSKEALRDLRVTLGVLRQVDEDAPAAPAPGLDRMAELVARAGTAGLEVRTSVEGRPRPVPPEVDLAAYRIVQEALTNVTRHARARTAVVRIRYGDAEVRVEIDDDGRGGPAESGNGIRGMVERARALGGELTTESGAGRGFQVKARLPLGVAS